MARISFVSLLLLTEVPLALHADSYWPLGNFRQADATGQYYVVVKKVRDHITGDPGRGTQISFVLAKRKPGTPAVQDVEDTVDPWAVIPNPAVKVREGDVVLARGYLERCPALLLISSTGLGLVGLDVRGYNFGSDNAAVIIGPDGKVRHRKDLTDIFSAAEIHRFSRSAGGIWWLGGGWIDDKRREVIVVGSNERQDKIPIPRLLRVVSMETGKVRAGSSREISAALADINLGALDIALDLAAEQKCNEAQQYLPAILANERLPMTTRLRSAVALGVLGDTRGADMMSRAVLGTPNDASDYALRHLPKVLGDKAAPLLCEAVRRHGEDSWSANEGMRLVSNKAAVPELIRLLEARPSDAAQKDR